MESPGKYLRAERESRNLSLEEVSESTKIRKHVLKAIEEDRYELLASVYLKGFLNTYAKYLGLNPNDVTLVYQRYLENKPRFEGPGPKLRITSSKLKQCITLPRERGKPRLFLIPIFIIFLFLAGYYVLLKLGDHSLPFSKRTEPALTPLPSVSTSPSIQMEVEAQRNNSSEESQLPEPWGASVKSGTIPESLQFEVLEAGLGTGIERKDDFLTLTGKQSEFVCNDQRVYFLTRIMAKQDGELVHVWLWEDREFYKQKIEIRPPGWSIYSFIVLRFEHAGDWRTEVRQDNKVLRTLRFKAIERTPPSLPGKR